MTLFEVFR